MVGNRASVRVGQAFVAKKRRSTPFGAGFPLQTPIALKGPASGLTQPRTGSSVQRALLKTPLLPMRSGVDVMRHGPRFPDRRS
jgi:hypothetical protein